MSDASAANTTAVFEVHATGILISRVEIRNFRCIDEIGLDLEPGTTYLVGENNSGKTSILYAIWSALGSRRPVDDDLHRTADGTPAKEASVDIWIIPSDNNVRFSTELSRQLVNVQRDQSTGKEIMGVRTVFKSNQEGNVLSIERFSLQPDDKGGWVTVQPDNGNGPEHDTNLLLSINFIEAYLLHASRDLVEEFRNDTSIWRRVLADLQIDYDTEQGETRVDLERALIDIAQRIRNASPVLSSLEEDLKGITEAQASVGRVELQPVSPRLEELARTADVVLNQDGQPVLPLRFQGLGSRSLATMLIFKTLARFRLGADRDFRPHLVTLLEEPEAHLHPQAISALQSLLDRLPGQRIISTHSPQLVVHTNPQSVRIIRRSADSLRIVSFPAATAKHIAQFRRYVERPFGEILFAKAIVFGDGSTERCVLPVLLSGYFGCHPASLGVSFFDCESMDRQQTGIIIQAAHDLGIRWFLFVDNDESGRKALDKIVHPVTGKNLTLESDEVIASGSKQMEQLLVDAGYSDEIRKVAYENGYENVLEEKECLRFLTENKPWAAERVAVQAVENDRSLPVPIVGLGQRLAESLDISIHTSQFRGGQ